jgi:hypothetical protein
MILSNSRVSQAHHGARIIVHISKWCAHAATAGEALHIEAWAPFMVREMQRAVLSHSQLTRRGLRTSTERRNAGAVCHTRECACLA